MGVKGLHSFLEGKLPFAVHNLPLNALADETSRNGSVVVVDGMATIRKMYPVDLEWLVGGQFQELWVNVASFVSAFATQGLSLVVFLDGGVDDAKLAEWRERRTNDFKKVERVVAALSKGEAPAKDVEGAPEAPDSEVATLRQANADQAAQLADMKATLDKFRNAAVHWKGKFTALSAARGK